MALLLPDLRDPPGVTPANRLQRASGMEAVAVAARGIGAGEMSLAIARRVESMTVHAVGRQTIAAFSAIRRSSNHTGLAFRNPLMEQSSSPSRWRRPPA
jgi:acetyl-CoA acetyltransferase